MTTRIHIDLPEKGFRKVCRAARAQGMSVEKYVRHCLETAEKNESDLATLRARVGELETKVLANGKQLWQLEQMLARL